MTARVNWRYLRFFVRGMMICGILVLWVCAAGAVKVVREKSAPAETNEKSGVTDQKRDSNATTTRSLLDDVESQKTRGSGTDSLDTWIDRDRDGVNDRMKESRRRSTEKTRIKKTAPTVDTRNRTTKTTPTVETQTRIKTVVPTTRTKNPPAPVKKKEPEKKDNVSTKNKQRR